MSQTNMQKAHQLLIIVMLIGLSAARPNGSGDNQESSSTADNQLGLSDTDMEKSFPYYHPMQTLQYFTYEDPNPTDRFPVQYRSFYPNAPVFRGSGGGGMANFPLFNPYRQLVTKRQTRYRQCYFNPISCFRK